MNKDTMNDKLFDIMSTLADDVLLMSEEEVDAELLEIGLDPDEVVTSTKTLLGKSILRYSSARLISEKKMADVALPATATIIEFAPGAAKAKLEELVNRNPEAFPELTMAARKGSSISDADARSQLEDLVSVGAIKIEDLK